MTSSEHLEDGAEDDPAARHRRSAELLTGAASGDERDVAALFDHPLLGLDVAGRRVHLEPDLVAARLAGRGALPVVDVRRRKGSQAG